MGHLGLTPQSIYKFGTYVVRAKELEEAQRLREDAKMLEAAKGVWKDLVVKDSGHMKRAAGHAHVYLTFKNGKRNGVNRPSIKLSKELIAAKFAENWSLDQTKAKREAWNNEVRAAIVNGKVPVAALPKIIKKLGFSPDELKKAINYHNL
jgi:hypothetical protein